MRKSLLTLGVVAVAILLATSAFAANRGVTFERIGFIDDPGDFPASLVTGMTADGGTLVTTPSPYGGYCTLTDAETLDWTHIGAVAGRCVISDDGSVIYSTYPDAEGVMKHAKWNGAVDDWTILPAPDNFAPCGSSGNSLYDIGGNGDFATGLTWDGCSYARASKYDAATNTNVDLGSMNGDSSRGNAISEDGNTIGGWTRMLCGGWRGAVHEDGAWSWVDTNGNNEPKACTESGGGCCGNYDCPEFVDDASCNNHGACNQTGIECDKAGIICDQAGIFCDNVGITCDLSGVDCVDEVCVGGPNNGDVCAGYWNCAGTCSGGVNEGDACNYNSHCPGTCVGGPSEGADCTSNYYCPGTCNAGPNSGGSCTGSSNCPGTCTAGANENGNCNYLSDCPGACDSGPNTGDLCTSDNNCPGTCEGGPSNGDTCNQDYYCPDTPACDTNPNWDGNAYKGEVADVTADGEYVLGYNFGNPDYNAPNYDPLPWASAYRRNPDGSFVQIPPPPGANPYDAWTPFAISDNGATVVGRYGWWIYSYPVLWTEQTGTLDLQYFLIGQGFDEMWFWYLTDLTSVSADGTIVAGHGNNPDNWIEGYVIDISKVKICHTPPGNPEGARTLSIGWDSIGDHIAHGDELATCEFLQSGARSRSVDEFRPTRPANMEVPAEAVDARWHDQDAMTAQRALHSAAQSAAPADTTTTPADRDRSNHQRPARRPQR